VPLESPQSDIFAESYDQNTETCAEFKFEFNPKLSLFREIPILLMQAKELDMLIIHVGMELNLHKTLCHFQVAQLQVELNLDKTLCHFLVTQLQDLEPNVSRKH
jgi:hypothetical protein